MDLLTLVALALLVLGVIGSVVPGLPGPLASLAGVYLYWWHTGFASPGTLALAGFTLLGLTAVVAEYLGGAVSARVGGASLATTVLAGVVGFALLFVVGPVGVLLGIAGTVFALEYRRNQDLEASLRTAGVATVGVLASAAVQFLFTGAMLVGFVLLLI